jgi:hypothetical protein
VAAAASAQPSVRRAANVPALARFPSFYHLRSIVTVGQLTLSDNGQLRLADDAATLRVVYKGNVPSGLNEIRGEFWDIGRFDPADPRLASYDLRSTFEFDPDGPWPRPGQVTGIVATTVAPASLPLTPSIRAIVLHPSRYRDQLVTIKGQFSGRNLLGELPEAPANSVYDFVIRSTDAAIWVSNLRPKGRDFDLALDARVDTSRWIEVSGTVREGRGLQWLDATGGLIALTKPVVEAAPEAEVIAVPAAPPPEVRFSLPLEGETEVAISTRIRIQFSRDLAPATLKERVRVSYVPPQAPSGNEPAAAITAFTTDYQPVSRVLEIRFSTPLERFRTVQVQLLDGILGTDEQPLKPWTLTFMTGGS